MASPRRIPELTSEQTQALNGMLRELESELDAWDVPMSCGQPHPEPAVKVTRISHVAPFVMNRRGIRFNDRKRDWQKEGDKDAEIEYLGTMTRALRGTTPLQEATAALACAALPSVPTHKPGAPRK